MIWHAFRYDQATYWRTPGPFFQIALPAMMLTIFGTMNEDAVELAGESYSRYLTVGMVTFTVATTAYAGMAVRIAYRREAGILQRLRTTPLAPSALIAGNVGSTLLVVSFGVVAVLATGAVLFDAPLPDRWLTFGAGIVLGAVACGALGIAMATFVRSMEGIDAMVWATLMPTVFISGAFQHVEPASFFGRLANVFPPRHVLALVSDGAGLPVVDGPVLVHVAVLLAWTAAGVAIGAHRFRWAPLRA